MCRVVLMLSNAATHSFMLGLISNYIYSVISQASMNGLLMGNPSELFFLSIVSPVDGIMTT
jgi:hypothetical protein